MVANPQDVIERDAQGYPIIRIGGRKVAEAQAILDANVDKDFVQRVNEIAGGSKTFPRIDNPDGSISTHLMSWGEGDGNYYVYPNIHRDDEGNLKDYGKDAFRQAMKTGEFIQFDTAEEADWFSQNYKVGWDE